MKNKKVTDEFTASWMDRCHKLELEVVELRKTLEYYCKLEEKMRQLLENFLREK